MSAPVISSLAQSQSNQHQGGKQVVGGGSLPGTETHTTTSQTHHTIQSSQSLFSTSLKNSPTQHSCSVGQTLCYL